MTTEDLDVGALDPVAFIHLLRRHHIHTFHVVQDTLSGRAIASHPLLQSLADRLVHERADYDAHEAVFAQIGPRSGVLQGAFVHRTCRGAGAGGVRNWPYGSVDAWFRDGLRLSKGMTHKNALAQIWWGGGKGVMARNTGIGLGVGATEEQRRVVYEEYGEFISRLRGCYVTAEDAGTSVKDMAAVFSRTRFTTCIPAHLGGSGNPSVPTARGVVRGLQAAFDHLGRSFVGSTIAVQGLGHVGLPLVQFLLEAGVDRILAADVDAGRIAKANTLFPTDRFHATLVDLHNADILFVGMFQPFTFLSLETAVDCDAVCPCAVGGVLDDVTIQRIRAPIVCGAANNQLRHIHQDDAILSKHNIVYVPDFLVNRMGIVNCADESYGYVYPDPIIERHLGGEWDNSIYNLTRRVLRIASESSRTPQAVALEMAETRSREPHPITGHRGVTIIQSLVRSPEWTTYLSSDQKPLDHAGLPDQ